MNLFLFRVVKPYMQGGGIAWDYSDWKNISFVSAANSEEEALAGLEIELPPKVKRVEEALSRISDIPRGKYYMVEFMTVPLGQTVFLLSEANRTNWERRWV